MPQRRASLNAGWEHQVTGMGLNKRRMERERAQALAAEQERRANSAAMWRREGLTLGTRKEETETRPPQRKVEVEHVQSYLLPVAFFTREGSMPELHGHPFKWELRNEINRLTGELSDEWKAHRETKDCEISNWR
jgi:hypothetical protein